MSGESAIVRWQKWNLWYFPYWLFAYFYLFHGFAAANSVKIYIFTGIYGHKNTNSTYKIYHQNDDPLKVKAV